MSIAFPPHQLSGKGRCSFLAKGASHGVIAAEFYAQTHQVQGKAFRMRGSHQLVAFGAERMNSARHSADGTKQAHPLLPKVHIMHLQYVLSLLVACKRQEILPTL